jgi:hypothetical protein
MIAMQANTVINIPVNGFMVLAIVMILGGWIGWVRGIRALLSVTLMTVIAYPIFVRGGQAVLELINPFYSNLPRIFALFTGGNIAATQQLAPLSINIQLPIIARVIGFVLLGIVLPWIINRINWPGWYASAPNNPAEPWGSPLGLFDGILLALLWTSAATIFWQELGITADEGLLGLIVTALNIIPDPGLLPLFVTMVFVVVLIVFNVPMIWAHRKK